MRGYFVPKITDLTVEAYNHEIGHLVNRMNTKLVDEHNRIVTNNDIVYFLGDIHLGKHHEVRPFIRSLKGYKKLIRGNHCPESKSKLFELGFDEVVEDSYIQLDGLTIWMNHIPLDNSKDRRGYTRPPAKMPYDLALCGHVHDQWLYDDKGEKICINVGVDQNKLAPWRWSDLRDFYEQLSEAFSK